jgi:hypothetical protein
LAHVHEPLLCSLVVQSDLRVMATDPPWLSVHTHGQADGILDLVTLPEPAMCHQFLPETGCQIIVGKISVRVRAWPVLPQRTLLT